MEYLQNVGEKYPNLDVAVIEEYISNLYPQIMNYGTNLLKNVVPMLFNVSVNVVKIVINLILSFVISCYMISDIKSSVALLSGKQLTLLLLESSALCLCRFSDLIMRYC